MSTSRLRNWASSRAARPAHDESGVGVISSLIGFLVFMSLLLVAVQTCFDLYERSMLGAVATDAARVVAGSDAGPTPSSLQDAEAVARNELGAAGRQATFSWQIDADDVALTVSLPATRFIPAPLAGKLDLATVSRTARYRLEYVR